jgi:hypothetical protein
MNQQANYSSDILSIEEKVPLIDIDDATSKICEYICYLLAAINICVAIIAVLGNGLVLYAAYGNRNNGRLNYLDGVIKSLAVNDLIYGFFGIPWRTMYKLQKMWHLHGGK